IACFGLSVAPHRCDEMTVLSEDSALGAFNALNRAQKILQPPPLPAGAIVFFAASKANGGWGHVCITSDDENHTISSGAPGSARAADTSKTDHQTGKSEDGTLYQYHNEGAHPDVWEGTVEEVGEWTQGAEAMPASTIPGYPGNFLGYTTAE